MASAKALLVGMNVCDESAYGGNWDSRLSFAESDARSIADITRSCGFDSTLLLSAEATKAQVVAEFRAAAQSLTAGDAFVFFYSGHGGRTRDKDGDEENGKDETLCFYDGQLIDDELYALWQEFDAGVRIFVVTDCCHSGSMLRGDNDDVPKSMSEEAAELLTFMDPEIFQRLREGLPPKTPLLASIIHIAGCHEDQESYENKPLQHGYLTAAMLDAWQAGPAASYADLYQAMYEIMPTKQKPVLALLGADSTRVDSEPPLQV